MLKTLSQKLLTNYSTEQRYYYGKFTPLSNEQLNRGFLIDNKDEKIETVILGKALSLLKKHIDLRLYWIVCPKNKTQNLHLVTGIWDPYQL